MYAPSLPPFRPQLPAAFFLKAARPPGRGRVGEGGLGTEQMETFTADLQQHQP